VSDSLGTVAALWRYPVKSLRGERLEQVAIGPSGIPGERTVVERHGGNLGVHARVEAAGEVRVGDPVVVLPS